MPVEPWAPNILDALEHGDTCVRPNQFGPDKLTQDENCLFLNVYVPGKHCFSLLNSDSPSLGFLGLLGMTHFHFLYFDFFNRSLAFL